MKPNARIVAFLFLAVSGQPVRAQQPPPQGEVQKYSFSSSTIFPGTVRDYWVYVPAEYDGKTPACLFVNQDGLGWNAPAVFDRLIAAKEMPVAIGVFVMHGRVPAAAPNEALDRFNRSLEYDGLTDRYARFLANELLPDVEKRTTKDGRAIHLSKDPNDRAIGGASSGAVCAFTAAWERPDLFRRVFSAIGTYVGLRGADRYPTLIRKYEPKPLRIFLQDGSNDQNIYAGDWWFENQMMERALTFAGYEVAHIWGEGGHSGQQGTEVFPDAMRWLWKDWPKPLAPGKSKNQVLGELLAADSVWQEAPAMPPSGPGGVTYSTSAEGVFRWEPGRIGKLFASIPNASALVVSSKGDVWAASTSRGAGASTLWRIDDKGKKTLVASATYRVGGLTLSPDQTLLYASDAGSHWVWSYRIAADGSLADGQQYYWLHVPDDGDNAGASYMCVDRDGRLYVATSMGVQVCDQAGRVNAILPLPDNSAASGIGFRDEGSTLVVASGSRLYRRKLAVKGRQSWEAPNKPAAPRL